MTDGNENWISKPWIASHRSSHGLCQMPLNIEIEGFAEMCQKLQQV